MTILIVDDNISTLNALTGSIDWEEIGIDKVLTAQSAAQADALMQETPVDILLCDIEMPQTDGLTFVRSLRSSGSNVICLFLTAHAEFTYARQAIELNSIDYILKPFSPAEVAEKLRGAVKLCQERTENSSYIKYGKLWLSEQQALPEDTVDRLRSPERETEHQGVLRAKEYMKDHYTEQITLNDIADYSGYNPSYLSTLFRQSTGVPPLDYLNRVRIRQAKLLLASREFSISDVAMMVGFQNVSYFNKIFKRSTGQTPGAYQMSQVSQ